MAAALSIFDRTFDPKNPATSGSRFLGALTSRIALSISYSVLEMPDAAWAELQKIWNVETLWTLSLVLAAWLIGVAIGGPIAIAVNGLLLAYGLYELWDVVKEMGDEFSAWLRTAYLATTDAELRESGKHFANALTKGGFTALEMVVTHRVFKAASTRVRDRFPAPEWLRKAHEEAEGGRKRAKQRVAEEETKRARLTEKLSGAAGAAAAPAVGGLRDAGVGIAVGGAMVLVVGTVVGAALLTRRRS